MNRIYILLFSTIMLWSCGDFLEEYSTQLSYARSCSDLEELLIGGGYMMQEAAYQPTLFDITGDNAPYFPWIHIMDDDIMEHIKVMMFPFPMPMGESLASNMAGFYTWQRNPFTKKGNAFRDETWSRLYKHIGVINVILSKVDDFTEDPIELRKRIKGEASFLRAYYYFMLVNFYGKPYDASTASTDPGVPLKITEYVEDKYYTRTPVAEVYKQIVTDLTTAVDNLKEMPIESIFQATEGAARTLLSRVYLYMGEWQKALEQCEQVKGYQLVNLVGRDTTLSTTYDTSPDMIFTQGTNVLNILLKVPDRMLFGYQVSDDLYNMYDVKDLRRKNYFRRSTDKFYGIMRTCEKLKKGSDGKMSDFCMIRYAEVYLNQAEALAMLGRDNEAVQVIQKLRENRFEQPGELNKAGEELVSFIRDERRRELCFEGHRWFDLRRYAVCPKYPMKHEIRHAHYNEDGTVEGTYALGEYGKDGGWVLPIPEYVITFNNGNISDNVREERTVN